MAKRGGKQGQGSAERLLAKRRQDIEQKFRARHPAIAREERLLRKANREIARTAPVPGVHRFGEATAETLHKARRIHQGSMARMFAAGAIDADQLAAAHSIRLVHERIARDVGLRTMSMETRVDQSRSGDGTFFERLGAVRAEMAYSRWRGDLPRPGPVLAMIVDDQSCRQAARSGGMRDGTARRLLAQALDHWVVVIRQVAKEVTAADLAMAHAGIL